MKNNGIHTESLKQAILPQYKSVRQFSGVMGIPYSTLVTALERGVDGMAYATVIRMCEKLSLNPVDFSPIEEGNDLSSQISTRKVMSRYNVLNKAGKKKILDIMEDYGKIDEYRNS